MIFASAYNRYILGCLSLLFTGGWAITCSSLSRALSVSYDATGKITASLTSFGAGAYCEFILTKWNGATVSEASGAAACTTAGTFDPSSLSLNEFEFGTVFTVEVTEYTDSNHNTVTCTDSRSITPPICRGGNYAETSLNVLKRPNGVVAASLTNKPLTGDCVYYTKKWAGSADTRDSGKIADCSATSFSYTGFILAVDYTVKMLNFADGATIATDQPVCGVNAVTIQPSTSGATLAATDVGYGVIEVGITGAAWGSKCEVTLLQWNTVSKSLRKVSDDCSSVRFATQEVGTAFAFGVEYWFEMAEYYVTDTNTAVVNPRYTTSVLKKTISKDSCDGHSNLVVTRADAASVAVTITGAKSYGACRLTMTEYNGAAASLVRVGLCTSTFRFTKDGTYAFSDADKAKFKYEVFASGDITGSDDCGSAPTEKEKDPFSAYSCSQAIQLDQQVGSYVFSLAQPRPVVGTCTLVVSDCGTSAEDPKDFEFPSCSSSYAVTFTDLVATGKITDLKPGVSCTFNWKYSGGATPTTCSAAGADAITQAVMIPLTISQQSLASDSITIVFGTLPSALTSYLGATTAQCVVQITGCNGDTITAGSLDKQTANPCTGQKTLSLNNNPGDNCLVEAFAYAGAARTDVLAYAGLTFSAAGLPAWGASQTPIVTMYGDECMQVSWDAPTTTGGAPIECYEVQRKDAAGSYYVAQNCTIGNTNRTAINCGFTQNIDYKYQVIAVNRMGRSADLSSVSIMQHLEYLQSAPATTYVSPSSSQKTFAAGAFPTIVLQAYHPDAAGTTDIVTADRLFVGTLVSRCKLDGTKTLKIPITDTNDADYSAAELPIPANSPPALTQVFEPIQGGLGTYRMVASSQPLAGAYSLVTYSLETGGLGGHYWSNPFFSGNTPTMTRKDPIMSFDWGLNPIINSTSARFYDLVSIRWTGFIEADFSETYTFFVEANYDQVRVWVDDVLIINKWEPEDLCASVCSGRADLQQSSSTDRKFSQLRIDFVHSKGPAQVKAGEFVLKWVSASRALEIIPTARLFKALVIDNYAAKAINVVPADHYPSASTFVLASQSFTTDGNYNIVVYAKDEFGNILQSSDTQFKATFTGSGGGLYTFLSVPADASKNNGTYNIPFSIPTKGTYTLVITDTAIPIHGSPITVEIKQGAAYQVVGPVAVAVAPHYVSSPVEFKFDVKDQNLNLLDGSTMSAMPPIHVSALWTGDLTTQGRLPVDDVSWRSARFGTLFTDATITYSGGKFRATITLPRAGTYDIDFSVDGGATAASISPPHTMTSAAVNVPSYAVVVTTPFPPPDMAVGSVTSVSVQLRDEYMNALSVLSNPAPNVYIRLQGYTGSNNQESCTPGGAPDGQFYCSITPDVSGHDLALSIVVDGTFAAYAYDNDGTVMYSRGPWYVDVAPGVVSASHCVLTGVRSKYTAGVAVDASLLLRDIEDNNLGPVEAWPTIAAELLDGASVFATMDSATFVYDAASGIVKIPIVATAEKIGLTLSVTIGGDAVSIPYGITTIDIVEGVLNARSSSCSTFADNPVTAGVSFGGYCNTRDAQLNSVTLSTLNTYTTFVHTTDQALAAITRTGTVDGSDSTKWVYATSDQLTKKGTYWYYTIMGQPGGLMAQYFTLSSFESLIGIDGVPLSNILSGDVSPELYTQIDAFIDFDHSGPIVVDDVSALSARWTGTVRAPISGDVTFAISCIGGFKLKVGDTTLDFLSATGRNEEELVITMVSGSYYAAQLDYVPDSTAALSFKWQYAGAPVTGSHVVPPSSLFTMLNAYTALKTVTVNPAAISVKSVATFSTGIVANQADLVIIQATDEFGNNLEADPACIDGTTPSDATCLFTISISPADATDFSTVSYVAGTGKVKVAVTFLTDGPKDVSVKLRVSGNRADDAHIQGSPYSIVVNAAR